MRRKALDPPAECRAVADAASFDYGPSAAESGLEYARVAEPEPEDNQDALPVYTLGVEELVAGTGLNSAEYSGWQFLSERSTGVVGTEVRQVADAGVHEFGHFALGPFPVAALSAVRNLVTQPDDGIDYEMRLLRVPALLLEALWLHSDRDILLPLEPAPTPLTAGELYESSRFFAVIQQTAVRSLMTDNSPRTGPPPPW